MGRAPRKPAKFRIGVLSLIVCGALVLLLTPTAPSASIDDDRNNIPEPKERHVRAVGDAITSAVIRPAAKKLNVAGSIPAIFQPPKEARNVSDLDEIDDSSWFINRNFWSPLSADKFGEGPVRQGHAPDAGPWTITKCKTEGIMRGLQIRDQKGDSYLLKFDPPDYLELSTAPDVISSKFLYAAGYNVPENFIVTFDPRILVMKDDLVCAGLRRGTPSSGTDRLSEFVEDLPRTKTGQLRAMASRFIPGKIKGPFSYVGVRGDDPNDRIPHEHRRELRGLRVIQGFLNNSDVKQLNTLDTYVEEDGRRFLKHYLIDFGGSLGSVSTGPKTVWDGYHYVFDPFDVIKTAFTLGLSRRRSNSNEAQYPSIGTIEGDSFEPILWRPNSPNPAFENMTERDGYWAAKIVASFTDEQIEAAVRAGQYSDPNAERALVRILEQRRDRVADYWFRRIAPLDRFRFTSHGLTFDDLAIQARLDTAANVKYEVRIDAGNPIAISQSGFETTIPISVGSPMKIHIKRVSPQWRELEVAVTVQLVEGEPTVVKIER